MSIYGILDFPWYVFHLVCTPFAQVITWISFREIKIVLDLFDLHQYYNLEIYFETLQRNGKNDDIEIKTDVVYVSWKYFMLSIQFWIIKQFDIPKGKWRCKTLYIKLNFTNQRKYFKERKKTKANNNKSFLITLSNIKSKRRQK